LFLIIDVFREMIFIEMPVHLRRTHNDESGLALINLAA
jgi:hypothetical protein